MPKLAQNDPKVQYEDAERCGRCEHFQPPDGCELVQGRIDAEMYCKLFEAKGSDEGGEPDNDADDDFVSLLSRHGKSGY